jgi:hypothetical protein
MELDEIPKGYNLLGMGSSVNSWLHSSAESLTIQVTTFSPLIPIPMLKLDNFFFSIETSEMSTIIII